MTIASIERVFTEDLTPLYGPEEAGSITWLVIGFVCKVNRTQYFNNKYDPLDEKQLATFYNILRELKQGVPVQYILGETEFYGSIFKIDPSVLIPRPETEELVDWILKDIKSAGSAPESIKILDIGTGSGCIPITLKKYIPAADVWAVDVSLKALELARENARLNEISVEFIEEDILKPEGTWSKFSIITSNPPYVTLAEQGQMHRNVLDHEPHLALFVPQDDPLIFYKAIASFATQYLEPGGLVYLEINENFGRETATLLRSLGFIDIELRQDLRGKDRMIKARIL